MKHLALSILLTAAAALLLLPTGSCQTFDPAPSATLQNDVNGAMSTGPGAPLVVKFSEPVVPSSIRIKAVSLGVPHAVDGEGNLLDEQHPPDKQAFKDSTVFAYDASQPDNFDATYGLGNDPTTAVQLTNNNTQLTITPLATFAVSVPYLLIVEPGLRDPAGHATVPRIKIPFTYRLSGGGPTRLPSGFYYFIMNVDFASQQLRLYADLDVDPKTGHWRGIFTDAARETATNSRSGCPASCPTNTPVCQLLNSALPRCVAPSEKQTALDQFPDFVPEPVIDNAGYQFSTDGFAKDEPDGSIAFGTPPFDIDVHVGPHGATEVFAKSTVISGQFKESTTEKGSFVGKGSFSVELLQLNKIGSDPTKGDFAGMTLTADQVKTVESFGKPIPKLPPK